MPLLSLKTKLGPLSSSIMPPDFSLAYRQFVINQAQLINTLFDTINAQAAEIATINQKLIDHGIT